MSVDDDLRELERQGLRRRQSVVTGRRPGWITVAGREYVDFASNDYLGLACHEEVVAAATEAAKAYGWGSSASPLVTGYHQLHQTLECMLAERLKVECTILFESGFAANSGVIPALVGPADIIFCEKRNHASLVDGCRLSQAKLSVYRSNQLDKLETRLAKSAGFRRRLIVTDTVFSMDGDIAPLAEVCALAQRYDAMVFADEAHAFGVLGPGGNGVAASLPANMRCDFRMVTLGKALGSVGAAVTCSQAWRDWFLNRARPYIYSTALPPAAAAATIAALRLAEGQPNRREHVLSLAATLRQHLNDRGLDTGNSATPIIPIILGEPERALAMAARLQNEGFWVTAIRPPTVSTGTSRIRVTLSAAHQRSQIETFATTVWHCR